MPRRVSAVLSGCWRAALSIGLIWALALQPSSAEEKPAAPLSTTVFVVRHAQKVDPADHTQGAQLSEEGRQAAERLARLLRSAAIAAVFATPTVRAHDTARPTATLFDAPVIDYDPRAAEQLATLIRAQWGGRSVLVVGHSNTVPAIVRALGGEAGEDLPLDEYDNLFIVTLTEIQGVQAASTVRLRLPQ